MKLWGNFITKNLAFLIIIKVFVQDIECDTKMIGCVQMCHNWFTPMTVSRYWLYHLMAVTSITIMFSAYKAKKYQDIYEAAAIRQLKEE